MRYRATARSTEDIDLLVEWDDALPERLQTEGWDISVARDPGAEPHLVRAAAAVRVDLIVAQTEYQRVALQRAADGWLTVEDVLVHKLIAWRPRDRDDIASILSTGAALDRDYVAHWAAEWEVTERWDEAAAG